MSRIGTAISLNQVPQEYKGLPMLGRGFTSIVYKKDDKALVLTRDRIKIGWMQEYMNGLVQSDFDTTGNRVRAYDDFPVYVVECDLMFPLDRENKKKLKSIMRDYDKVYVQARKNAQRHIKADPNAVFWETKKIYDSRDDEIAERINKILSFMADWDCQKIDFTLTRNWMQTASGELKCVDPVVDEELLNIAHQRYNQKHNIQKNSGYSPKKVAAPGMDY